MSSVLRFMKQIPTDTPYFISLLTQQNLNVWQPDPAASTTSYVSGAAAGRFTTSNITVNAFDAVGDASGVSGPLLFRDMGKTIISSGRMFRRVQLLTLDGNGGSGWTNSNATGTGVWQAGVEGVYGNPSDSGTDDGYRVFYFETGARGLGVAQGLVRYG